MRLSDGTRRLCESACCTGAHGFGADCDPCPFVHAGEPGQLLLRLFYAAASSHEDPKTHHTSWSLDRQGIVMAMDLYSIHRTQRQRAFELLGQACAILNGQAGAAPALYRDDKADA